MSLPAKYASAHAHDIPESKIVVRKHTIDLTLDAHDAKTRDEGDIRACRDGAVRDRGELDVVARRGRRALVGVLSIPVARPAVVVRRPAALDEVTWAAAVGLLACARVSVDLERWERLER